MSVRNWLKACLSVAVVMLGTEGAVAQSSPSPAFYYGFIPTAGQWNAYFQAKQDYLGFTPMGAAGGTFSGKIYTLPSSVALAGLNLGVGSAPTVPQNGDLWMTTSGLFAYIGGVTYGPYLGGLSGDVLVTGANTATIQPNVVTYAKEAQSGTNTVVGNATASTANKTDLPVPSCSGAAQALIWTTNTGFGCATIVGGAPEFQGRLTAQSTFPIPTVAVIGGTNVYYTPYNGNQIALWNGSAFINTAFTQLTNVLANSSVGNAGPAAAVAASVYDMFVWNNGGTPTLTRGPAWTNLTTRSAGTAIAQVNGVYTNSVAITNGPGIGAGTYLGTIATDSGGATITYNPLPAPAASGPTGGAWLGLWNQYNRIIVTLSEQDSTASWVYSTNAWRAVDGSANNRVTLVLGNREDSETASYFVQETGGCTLGIDVNSTTNTPTPAYSYNTLNSTSMTQFVNWAGILPTGEIYVAPVENELSSCTFNNTGSSMSFTVTARF